MRAYLAARWRGSRLIQELDDTVQDVFIECLRQGGLLDRAKADRPGRFRAFLYGAVRNVALRVEARQARQHEREPGEAIDIDFLPGQDKALSRVFDRTWAKTVVRQAAEHLSELAEQRGEAQRRRVELLRLRFHEEMPIREIARLWNVNPVVLHHEYARARQGFRSACGMWSRSTIPAPPIASTASAHNSLPCLNNCISGLAPSARTRAGSRGIPRGS